LAFVLANRGFLHPVHSRILEGVEEECEEAGAFVIYTRLQYRPDEPFQELRVPRAISNFAADCLILAGANYSNLTAALDHRGAPYVYLGNNLSGHEPSGNGVYWDDIGGAKEATRYLIELGHRDIWYLGDITRPWLRRPYEGYAAAMQQAGLPVRCQTVALASDSYTNGRASMEMILEHGFACSALVADAEELEGALAALDAAGRSVPRDVSAIAIGSLTSGREERPLTSVDVDFVHVGRVLASQAMQKARAPYQDVPDVNVPTELVKRASCRPFGASAADA
jgi:LacI family transcriptional regulator